MTSDPSAVISGVIPDSSGGWVPAEITVAGDRISAVTWLPGGHETASGERPRLLPGLIDLHCHGGGGASFTSGDPDQITAAARHHHARGTTSLLASAVTDTPERLLQVLDALADAADAGVIDGIHLEGPFLAAARCGAQDPRHMLTPEPALMTRLIEAARGHLRVMTMAPELPGAAEVTALARAAGVVVAAGHTEASTSVIREHLRGAPSLVTHLFNGMAPIHHRDPGPALGALVEAAAGETVVELIADGAHLDDQTVLSVLDLVGPDNVALVTDAMAAAGMPDGDYQLGPLPVRVQDGVARLADGSSLAGGTAHALDLLARLVRSGESLARALPTVTTTPARLMGWLDRGRFEVDGRADLIVLDDARAPGSQPDGVQPDRAQPDGDWRAGRVMHQGRWLS